LPDELSREAMTRGHDVTDAASIALLYAEANESTHVASTAAGSDRRAAVR